MKYEDKVLVLRTVASNPDIPGEVFMALANMLFGLHTNLARRALNASTNKIDAIRIYKSWTGDCLKDAKEIIEEEMSK
jgi:hypothetical protein